MTLREARVIFTTLICKVVEKATELGYEAAYDEVTNHQGVGHRIGSLHYFGCAADVLLYKDGTYLTKTADYQALGEYWESLHKYCKWGGRFSKPDGNHFSFSPPELFGDRA